MINPWLYIDLAAFLVVLGLTGFIIPQILQIKFIAKRGKETPQS